MNGTFNISKEDTIKILKRQVESKYECGTCTIDAKVTNAYYDPRDLGGSYEQVNFIFKFKKDLGLGIGDSTIEVSITDNEAKGLFGKLFTESGIETTDMAFKTTTVYDNYSGDRGIKVFDGITVQLKEKKDTFSVMPPKMINGI